MGKEPRMYPMNPILRAAEISSLRGRPAAIGAFNVNFYAQAEGVFGGLYRAAAPGIFQASKGANEFQGGPEFILQMIKNAAARYASSIPFAVHLDHGNEKAAISCIDRGFSSVMIDASKLSELENIALTRKITELAHAKGISVEAEYGLLSGVEEDVAHQKAVYADPKFVPVFLDRSCCDALAIAYGTSHGPNKGNTEALNVQIVRDSYAGLQAYHINLDHFLVSHGSSTVPAELVARINKYGGKLENAQGVPQHKIVEAIRGGIRKVNIDTDLRLAMTGELRRYFHEHPTVGDESELVAMIQGVFSGKIKQGNQGKPIEDPSKLTDPRDYLWYLKSQNPEALRNDYRKSGDERFIEVMGLLRHTVSEHVEHLCRMFGAAGLSV